MENRFSNTKLESHLEKILIRECKKHNIYQIKIPPTSSRGLPDRLLLYNSKAYFVELKRKNQKPRPSQVHIHETLLNHGFRVYVIDSEGDLNRLIEKILGG